MALADFAGDRRRQRRFGVGGTTLGRKRYSEHL